MKDVILVLNAGSSSIYIVSVLPGITGDRASGRVVVAHLGNGSSMCAMRDGMSPAWPSESPLLPRRCT